MKKSISNFISFIAIVLAFCFALTVRRRDGFGERLDERIDLFFECGKSIDYFLVRRKSHYERMGNRANYGFVYGQSVGNAHCRGHVRSLSSRKQLNRFESGFYNRNRKDENRQRDCETSSNDKRKS